MAVAFDEFLRAVQRVDEEEPLSGDIGNATCGDLLLRDDRNIRKGGRQIGKDDPLGTMVRIGHGRGVSLVGDSRTGTVNFQDGLSGGECRCFQYVQHCFLFLRSRRFALERLASYQTGNGHCST